MSIIWFFASFLKSVAYYTPFLVLVMHMDSLGISRADSTKGMMSVAVCELLTRLAVSYWGDKIKGKFLAIYAASTFLLAILNWFGAFATTITGMIIYGCGINFFFINFVQYLSQTPPIERKR